MKFDAAIEEARSKYPRAPKPRIYAKKIKVNKRHPKKAWVIREPKPQGVKTAKWLPWKYTRKPTGKIRKDDNLGTARKIKWK